MESQEVESVVVLRHHVSNSNAIAYYFSLYIYSISCNMSGGGGIENACYDHRKKTILR